MRHRMLEVPDRLIALAPRVDTIRGRAERGPFHA